MKLSIIIPVYNEADTLKQVLDKVHAADALGFEKEIVVVDDDSQDLKAQPLVEPLEAQYFGHKTNLGKGAAIKTGLIHATGEIVLIQDADLEYDPTDFPALLSPFQNPETQVVYGVRATSGYWQFSAGNKIFTKLINWLCGSNLQDPYTGYKVLKKDLLDSLDLKSNGFEIEAEVTAKLLKKKIKIVQVPISYYPRTFDKGKKIRFLRDGSRGLWTFFKYWLKK